MEILAGVCLGLVAWFLLRVLLMGVYTVDQNERAVKTRFGRAVRTRFAAEKKIQDGLPVPKPLDAVVQPGAGEVLHHAQHLIRLGGRKHRGGLIQKKNGGLGQQLNPEVHPFFLATGKRVDGVVFPLFELKNTQRPGRGR